MSPVEAVATVAAAGPVRFPRASIWLLCADNALLPLSSRDFAALRAALSVGLQRLHEVADEAAAHSVRPAPAALLAKSIRRLRRALLRGARAIRDSPEASAWRRAATEEFEALAEQVVAAELSLLDPPLPPAVAGPPLPTAAQLIAVLGGEEASHGTV